MSAALRARGSWHVSAAVGVWGHGGPGTCLRPCGQGGPGTCLRLYSPVPGGTGALARVCGSGGMRRGTLADCCLALSGTGVLARVSGSAARRRGKKVPTFFLALSSAVREKKFGPFSGASLLSVFSPQEQQQRQQSRSVRSAWCRCRGLRRRRRRRRRPCSGQRGLESQARAL